MVIGAGAEVVLMSPIRGSTSPPAYRVSSSTARCSATSGSWGSTPRSNRLTASLGSLCRRAVRATVTGSQWAASSSTLTEVSVISLFAPPITAANDTGPVSSQITMSSGSSSRSTPSRVVSRSPALARRTTSPPVSRSGSNACIGWPSSSIR